MTQMNSQLKKASVNINMNSSSNNFCSVKNSLKFASLNVCGLKRRVLFPEFSDLVSEYDVFCVCETKLDKYDVINLPGYVFHSQCRKQKYVRKSGGLGIFIKQSLSSYVSFLESDSDYVLWLSISKEAYQTDEDFFIGAIYIPPNDSRFYNPNEIEQFNVEVTNMCVSNKYVLLMGDFNARTQNKQDFLEEDEFFSQHFDFDDDLTDLFQNSSVLDKCNLPKIRTSQDKIVNNEGNMLIDICKTNSLFILNGRCGSDKSIGAMTFRNQSVIDYAIVSHHALKFVKMFSILEVDSLFSDGHSLITTTLSFSQELAPTKNKRNKNRKKRPKLPASKTALFVQNLDYSKITELNDNIMATSNDLNSINLERINDICHQFSEIYNNSSKLCTSTDSSSDYKKGQKVWFGRQCEKARKQYHVSKSKHSKYPSVSTKIELKQASKTYKKKMNYFINKHNKSTQNKLRSLKNKSPKEYWKIINSIDNKRTESNIELDTLYTFFKDLNKQPETDNDYSGDNIEISVNDDDEILNSPISDGEILKCIKLLKNNKACANDDIINEYIKSTSHIMLPLYTSFFNLIFETGIMPDAWLEGIIKPIYKKKGDPLQPENYRPITILSCFGKLFTAVLNLRLTRFLNEHETLAENQAGF